MPLKFYSENTIRTYDFTKGAYYRIEDTIFQEDFEKEDADAIIKALMKKTYLVDFTSYLKRYLFKNSKLDCPFDSVTEQQYKDMIDQSFERNAAPYHFEKNVKRSQVIRRWMQGKISRSSMFVLGFGLGMTDTDVSDFLMKVLKERDFDFTNKEETVYWFCYKNHLSYRDALQILAECEASTRDAFNEKTWKKIYVNPKKMIMDRINLQKYVAYLFKIDGTTNEKRINAYTYFTNMYQECCKIIASQKQEDTGAVSGEEENAKIGPADLERVLYCGLSRDENGNVISAKGMNTLEKYLNANKLTRQRIATILKSAPEKNAITRYDLITLKFFIYSEKEYMGVDQIDRCDDFIDEMNQILADCGFYGMYPVNPYEQLIIMCLVAVLPMDAFAEVMQKVLGNLEETR